MRSRKRSDRMGDILDQLIAQILEGHAAAVAAILNAFPKRQLERDLAVGRWFGDSGRRRQALPELARAVAQPKHADKQHKAMLQYLEKLSGRDFDLAYIRGQSLRCTSLAHGAASSGAGVGDPDRAGNIPSRAGRLRHERARTKRTNYGALSRATQKRSHQPGPIFQRKETREAARC